MLPLSFILTNISLFLGILTGILMGMLIGLSMIAQSLQVWAARGRVRTVQYVPVLLQPVVELGVLMCTMWGRMRSLRGVVVKNLAGHRSRNRKTS